MLDHIRAEIGGAAIWASIDETTDAEGRLIGNVIVGRLDLKPSRAFLIHSATMERVNHTTIGKLLNEGLQVLYPNGVQFEKLLLLVTDAAAYMIKAATGLQTSYPKMVHLTCLAHGLHRVAEHIRSLYPDIDSLISCIKKIFVKAPLRVQIFTAGHPNLPLPPEPVITRWGTWLNAALYYAENLTLIAPTINSFDETDAAAIRQAQQLLKNELIPGQLAFIKAHFSSLSSAITQLESVGMLLSQSLSIVAAARADLAVSSGEPAVSTLAKFDRVLANNTGYTTLQRISRVLLAESERFEEPESELTPSDIANFKFAPITSCDVERSFSIYRHILSDRRRGFTFENLKMTLIVNSNFSSSDEGRD